MALSRRGKRKIMVDGVEYLWWVQDVWGDAEVGVSARIATPDRRFDVEFTARTRAMVVRVHGSWFGRGEVERGATLRCGVTPADVYVMPSDIRQIIDWCQTPGPIIPYIPPPHALPEAPETAVREAIWPLVRALRSSSLVWSAAVCDEEEQPLPGSPLLLHTNTRQLELWALGDQLAASQSVCALERAPTSIASSLPAEAAWLMDPAPLSSVRGQYISVASMYVDEAERCCRVVSMLAGGQARPVYVMAEQDRLVISQELPRCAAGLHYRADLI